ncbi:MAG: hypothetical protein QXU71_01820 [Candidatus Aenigmatarchaeota archaeon]
MKKKKGLSMSLLTMIVIFIAVLALSIALFNPGGVIEKFKEMLEMLKEEGGKEETRLLSGNKALHVYLGLEDPSKPNIYEFHLFNNLKHEIIKAKNEKLPGRTINYRVKLSLRDWKRDKCAVVVSEKTLAWGDAPNRGGNRIYYVDVGTIVQDDVGISSLNYVLRNVEGKCKCIENEKDIDDDTFVPINFKCTVGFPIKSSSGVCDSVDRVLKVNFGSSVADACKEFISTCPKDGCCSLLYKTDIGNYIYRIKYGIICGYSEDSDEAYWWACTEENSEIKVNAMGKTYTCKFEKGFGKWVEA